MGKPVVGILSAALALAVGASQRTLAAPASSSARNVILVSIDTLRADHLGTYGYSRDTSPHLDALAREGVLFERALAHAPNTPPSQASLMTSLYPGRHGFTGNGDRLPAASPTLAELVRRAGLRTGGFVDGGYLSHHFGFARGFDAYDDEGGGIAEILPRAERWIAQNRDRRFFLFLHCYDVHAPYAPPPPYLDFFHETPWRGSFSPTRDTMLRAAFRGLRLSPEEVAHAVARYDEEIRYTDATLGGFFGRLRESGVLDQSVLIVTSDHGEEFGEHGSFTHWQLFYQPDLRVPLLVVAPGLPRAVRVRDLVQVVDILPTLLELLGLPPLEEAQGVSLVPLLHPTRPGAADFPSDRASPAWPPDPSKLAVRSLVAGRYQLRFQPGTKGPVQLFDVEADPLAQLDVAAGRPEVVESLLRRGEAILGEEQPLPRERIVIDESTREQLRALGYVE